MIDSDDKYEKLNKTYVMMESQLEEVRVRGKGKAIKAIEVDLMIKKNEIKVLRVKLNKE